jgi:hypothetical protein
MEAQEAEIEMLNAVQAELVVKNDHDIKTHQRDALSHHLKALMRSLQTSRAFHLWLSQTRADCRSLRLLHISQRHADQACLACAFETWVVGKEDDAGEENKRVQEKIISAQNILAEVLMASPSGHRRVKGAARVNAPLGERQADRHARTCALTHTHTQAQRQTDRQTDRQAGRQTRREREREREREMMMMMMCA